MNEEEFNEAFDRVARTPDGLLIYRFLQMRVLGVLAEHAPLESALRGEHAVRKFASELMGRMAKGIDESDGRTDRNRSPSERTVVIRRASAQRAPGRVTAREWLAADSELSSLLAAAPTPPDGDTSGA